ncbi:MAG: glycosyltransferase family 39 protein, partial [Pyrinomonadaceae bacterium]|nr:glycosyltransferase family 39 protein [Pyrinomonadaceae bacterium]
MKLVLIAGILLRIVVFLFQTPYYYDPHFGVIKWIIEHTALPRSDQAYNLGFHPPLYYLLAVPLAIVGPVKVVQGLSLLLSIANYYLLFRIIKTTPLLRNDVTKFHVLLFAAVLPQFVIHGNFVSNDTLAYLVGTLTFLQAFAYIDRPTGRRLSILGVVLGIGLLTKGTLIAFVPPLVLLVVMMGIRQQFTIRQHIGTMLLFCSIAGVVGSYKFVQNTIHFGRPIVVYNVNPHWLYRQQGTYQGLRSLVDVNLFKLVQNPYLSEHTRHSIPLLFYATFWPSYISGESNFDTARLYTRLSRTIYLAGLLPTLLAILGVGTCLWRNRSLELLTLSHDVFAQRVKEKVVLLLFVFNLALVITAGLKIDVWSCFHARYLFPSFLAILLFLGWGLEAIVRWRAWLRPGLLVGLCALSGILTCYYAIEIGALLRSDWQLFDHLRAPGV